MADYTGATQLAAPADAGVKLQPAGTGFVAVGYDTQTASVPQPMIGGRLLYIEGGKIKALPEATA